MLRMQGCSCPRCCLLPSGPCKPWPSLGHLLWELEQGHFLLSLLLAAECPGTTESHLGPPDAQPQEDREAVTLPSPRALSLSLWAPKLQSGCPEAP